MAHRRLLVSLGAAGLAVALVSGPLAGQETLRYRWTKGEALRYRVTVDTATNMTVPGGMGDMSVGNVISQMQTMTTDSIGADGLATVSAKTDSVRMDMTTPMGTMTYDSASATPPADPMIAEIGKVMGAMVGETIVLVIAPDGSVKSVAGGARLLEKVKQNLPPGADAAMAGLAGLDGMMGDEAMKAQYGQNFGVLPPKPLKAGETWKTELKVPNAMGEMTIAQTFSMHGATVVDGRSLTRIGVAFDVKVAPGGMMGPMSVTAGPGTGDGDIYFDNGRGRLQKTVIRMTLPMGMSMTTPDGQSMNMSGTTRTTTTVELVER